MVDVDRVNDLLLAAEAYLSDVRAFAARIDRATFVADRGEQYRIAFPLQQAIQLAIDLAAHLLAGQPGHRPDTLAGLFTALGERDVVEDALAMRLAAMARFRNLLVHQYADLDPDRVWDIVHGDLADVDRFLAVVAAHLDAS